MTTQASLAASGVVVAKSVEIKGKSAADIAKSVAGFCAIETWHPAIAKCAEVKEGNDTFRILTLKDGGEIKEKRTSQSETSYGYKIVSGPPREGLHGDVCRKARRRGRRKVEWVASFQAAKGTPEADAKKTIEGIFEAGIKGISEALAK